MIRALLVYASESIGEGLQAIFRAASDLEVIERCATVGELRPLADQFKPNVLVVELGTVGPGGFHVLQRQLADCADIATVLVTPPPEPGDLAPLISVGAKGIIAATSVPRDLVAAIRAVHDGRRYLCRTWRATLEHGPPMTPDGQELVDRLTPREWQVFRLLAAGCSTPEVATALDISAKTVNVHRSHLLGKLHLKNNAHLARLATELGLLH